MHACVRTTQHDLETVKTKRVKSVINAVFPGEQLYTTELPNISAESGSFFPVKKKDIYSRLLSLVNFSNKFVSLHVAKRNSSSSCQSHFKQILLQVPLFVKFICISYSVFPQLL